MSYLSFKLALGMPRAVCGAEEGEQKKTGKPTFSPFNDGAVHRKSESMLRPISLAINPAI